MKGNFVTPTLNSLAGPSESKSARSYASPCAASFRAEATHPIHKTKHPPCAEAGRSTRRAGRPAGQSQRRQTSSEHKCQEEERE